MWACFVRCIMQEAKSSNIVYSAVSFVYIFVSAPAEECVAIVTVNSNVASA